MHTEESSLPLLNQLRSLQQSSSIVESIVHSVGRTLASGAPHPEAPPSASIGRDAEALGFAWQRLRLELDSLAEDIEYLCEQSAGGNLAEVLFLLRRAKDSPST